MHLRPLLHGKGEGDCHQTTNAAARAHLPHPLPFFFPYIVPILTVVTQYSSTAWHALIPPFFVWVIVPLLDLLLSSCRRPSTLITLTLKQRRHLDSQLSFRVAVYLWPLTQLALLLWSLHRLTSAAAPSATRLLGLTSSITLAAAEGIICAHELLHGHSRIERLLADLLLVLVCYGHFSIEHARGHHVRVATPHDPATLQYNQSFYSFLPRTVFGGFSSACHLEARRLHAERRPILSLRNRIVRYVLAQTTVLLVVAFVFGWRALCLFVAQAAGAVVLLEQVNAIEHYGLRRRRLPDGTYERVGPRHSWDAPQSISSYLLFKLQLHADHHLHATRRYQSLHVTQASPQLPAGYLSLAPILLIPPLWRAVMHPVLHNYWAQWELEDKQQHLSQPHERHNPSLEDTEHHYHASPPCPS